ncbi:hypothetical protein BD408DRAFT_409215 [Parasitella parasitica]|nr:hypothetical protein BD408DRAFT_409215 [Parasitella parasitica]
MLLISAYFCITAVHAAGNNAPKGPGACLLEGKPCGISVDGFHGAKCCKGTYCVAGACKVLGNTFPPPKAGKQKPQPNPKPPSNPLAQQTCREKLKGAGCGNGPIDAIGQFCVCQCPNAVATLERFSSSCIPTMEDRAKLIKNCREYKALRDCPQFKKQLAGNTACVALKDQFTKDCAACGKKCISAI